MKEDFCSEVFKDKMADIISGFVDLDEQTINRIYSEWREPNPPIYSASNVFYIDKLKYDGELAGGRNFGLDLPTWFNFNNAALPKIMVFGLNPLRQTSDWDKIPKEYKPDNSFLLGSAWASCIGFVQKPNITLLKALGIKYRLYLSDIQKLYFEKAGLKSQNIKSYVQLPMHEEILKREIDMVQPDYIVLLGNEAARAFGFSPYKIMLAPVKIQLNQNRRFIVLPHTSGRIREGNREKFAEANNKVYVKGEFINSYLEIIDGLVKNG